MLFTDKSKIANLGKSAIIKIDIVSLYLVDFFGNGMVDMLISTFFDKRRTIFIQLYRNIISMFSKGWIQNGK